MVVGFFITYRTLVTPTDAETVSAHAEGVQVEPCCFLSPAPQRRVPKRNNTYLIPSLCNLQYAFLKQKLKQENSTRTICMNMNAADMLTNLIAPVTIHS